MCMACSSLCQQAHVSRASQGRLQRRQCARPCARELLTHEERSLRRQRRFATEVMHLRPRQVIAEPALLAACLTQTTGPRYELLRTNAASRVRLQDGACLTSPQEEPAAGAWPCTIRQAPGEVLKQTQ
jgi:hypothetical protein